MYIGQPSTTTINPADIKSPALLKKSQALPDGPFEHAYQDQQLSEAEVVWLIQHLFYDGEMSASELRDLKTVANSPSTDPKARQIASEFLKVTSVIGYDMLGGLKLFEFQLKSAQQAQVKGCAKADKLIAAFSQSSRGGVFKHLTRAQIGIGMYINTRFPSLIKQGTSSLCGPSSLLFNIARDNPAAYAQFAIDLYETGVAKLGTLKIEAGSDLRAYAPPLREISGIDWMTAASIRDSENWFLDYQATSDSFAGITMPSALADWLKQAGYSDVKNHTNTVAIKDAANAHTANDYFKRNYRVCLFINGAMLYGEDQTSKSVTASHWVVLTSPMVLSQAKVQFKVFTWGQGKYSVPRGDQLSMDDFLDNYYGFVAAKF